MMGSSDAAAGTFVFTQLSLAGDEQSSKPTRIALNDARYIALPVFQSLPIDGSPPLNIFVERGT